MRFAGTLTERDLSSARSLFPSPARELLEQRAVAVLAPLGCLALALLNVWISGDQTVFWLVLALVVGAAGLWTTRQRRKELREDATLDGTISGTVSDGGVAYHTPLHDTFWRWDDLLSYVASDGLLLIRTTEGRCVLLAQTLFASEAEWSAAVRHVKTRLPENSRRGLLRWQPVALSLLLLMILFLAWHFARLTR